jgi:diamine N-acetyltransferase
VTLREIDADTVRAICALRVTPAQEQQVAHNAVSIAQAHFEPAAWFRAVYANDEPVGFAMLYDPTRAAPRAPRHVLSVALHDRRAASESRLWRGGADAADRFARRSLACPS